MVRTIIGKGLLAKRRRHRWAWGIAFLLALGAQPSGACTLWGAAGDRVAGGGTLIAKNRDWAPNQQHELVILRPAEGHRSVALMALGGDEPGVKAGVNEKGLAIVSATASQVPSAERKSVQQRKGLIHHLLTTCVSVADVLQQLDLMHRPVFYLVADRKEIAVVEVAPDGQLSVRRASSGTLHHTNHYCAIEPGDSMRKPGASSRQRYGRIEALLNDAPGPFTPEDFIRFSEDRNAGPDNSIWRTGSTPDRHRTLAAWLVTIPASGSPGIYLKTADPGQPERVCRLSVAEALRLTGGDRIPLSAALCRGTD
jgi:hypothetical protein